MLYSRVYFLDNVFAGCVVDIIVDGKGRIIAFVLARVLLPLVKVGLGLFIVPYRLVGMVRGCYCILVSRGLLGLKNYLYMHLSPLIVEYVYRGRVKRFAGLSLMLLFAVVLLVVAFMCRSIGVILYLIATSIILVFPFILHLASKTSIPGYYTIRSIIGSRVHDVYGYLVGIVCDVSLDLNSGRVTALTITRPVHAVSKAIGELYGKRSRLVVGFNLVESISDGVVKLKISYTKLLLIKG